MDADQIRDIAAQVQGMLEAMYPATVKIDGQDYAGSTTGFRASKELMPEGFESSFDIVFRVRKSILAEVPALGKRIEWEGQSFRVAKTANKPLEAAWYMGCVSPDK